MRLAKWALILIKGKTEHLLYLSLWLVGIPACLGILFLLFLRPVESGSPVRFMEAERWIEPLSGYGFDTAGFEALSRKTPDFAQANWTPVSLPDVAPLPAITSVPDAAAMARVWLRVRYIPPANQKTSEPLAIYDPRIMGGAYAVWVNGKMVHVNIEEWRMQWNKPLLVKISAQELVPGKPVEIMVAVPYRPTLGYAFGSLYAGPVMAIQRMYDIRFLLHDSMPRGGILVAVLLGFFSFQFWLARRSETPHLLLSLASVAWFICNLQYFIDFNDDSAASRWFGAIVDASVSWVILLCFMFAFRIAGKEFPRLEKALLFYAIGVSVITLPVWNWEISALVLQHYGNLAMGLGLNVLFSWVAWRDGRREVRLVSASLWPMMLFGLHDVLLLTSQHDPDGIHLFPYATFLLFGSFMYSIQRGYIGAVENVEALNASLNERLQARERELEAKHEELRDVEKREAMLTEQQRLIREMHDGIGAALMSSLVLAEQKRLPPERIASILRDCNDELKLVIDSLEPYEQDLVTMLASVLQRLRGRIEEAGIHIDWEMDDLPRLAWFDQTHVLHVLRIVQEALTNILKHAQATRIKISASQTISASGVPLLLIRISDNGSGYLPVENVRGRGLKSMRYRARQLHGELSIDARKGSGTTIELRLPIEIEAPVSQ